MKEIISHIESNCNLSVKNVRELRGGDISNAYILETNNISYFLKTNKQPQGRAMFEAEAEGLKRIRETNTIGVPHVIAYSSYNGKAFLLMEFIESKNPSSTDFKQLGEKLALLHQYPTNAIYGLSVNNFIGSLYQDNSYTAKWEVFYWRKRLLPQMKLASNKHLLNKTLIPSDDKAIEVIKNITGNEVTPTLLHGDLWSGNYIIAKNGTPFLIDPAIYQGHAMVDIAMTRLFGGFAPEFYDAYHSASPKPANYYELIDLYQLYYLLVHLNLFGSTYYTSVKNILCRYF